MIEILRDLPASLASVKPNVSQLFYQGNLKLLKGLKVAIVGSRRPSVYSKNLTFSLASALKEMGAVVVSGAAMGIDAQAHKGAYPQTIAVMANSLDIQAPAINKGLITSMSNDALCLSEYPVSTHPTAYTFVQRNRIVVGLSDIVVLAQADLKSGTMRSAEFALKFDKPLFVFSHRTGESLGTQELLQEGKATAIYSIQSFIKTLCVDNAQSTHEDELLAFCSNQPSYDDVFAKFQDKLFEYELLGKVEILHGRVVVVNS